MGLLSVATVVLYNMQPRRLMAHYPTAYLLAWEITIGGIVLALVFQPWEEHNDYTLYLSFLLALGAIIFLGSMGWPLPRAYVGGSPPPGPGPACMPVCELDCGHALIGCVAEGPKPIDFLASHDHCHDPDTGIWRSEEGNQASVQKR